MEPLSLAPVSLEPVSLEPVSNESLARLPCARGVCCVFTNTGLSPPDVMRRDDGASITGCQKQRAHARRKASIGAVMEEAGVDYCFVLSLTILAFCRSQSRFFSVSRLSCSFFPCANSIRAFTRCPFQ